MSKHIEEVFGLMKSVKDTLNKVGYKKEYQLAMNDMKKEKISAADAAKRYTHVDARKLQAMAESVEDNLMDKIVEGCSKSKTKKKKMKLESFSSYAEGYDWSSANTDVKGMKKHGVGRNKRDHLIKLAGEVYKDDLTRDQAFKMWKDLGGKKAGYVVHKEGVEIEAEVIEEAVGDNPAKTKARLDYLKKHPKYTSGPEKYYDEKEAKRRGKRKSRHDTQMDLKLEGVEVEEEVAANSVAGGGVDMNPTGKILGKKRDKRSKWDVEKLFKRANGQYKK